MDKPRIFLGSSGKQEKLIQALTRGLADIARVEPWTTVFNPGISTLDRLVELTREVDFAAFVFAQDDWTTPAAPAAIDPAAGLASPRDNVVFEAGLFGGVLGMRRTFILHASGAKLPTDLLGLTCVRYPGAMTPAEMKVVNHKLRKAIEDEGGLTRVEGAWWQFSLTARTGRSRRPQPAQDFARPQRRARGEGQLLARGWPALGALLERGGEGEGAGLFYYWNGERPLDPDAPQLHGTGEVKPESEDRASGYWTTRSESDPEMKARTVGTFWRADPEDVATMDGRDDGKRVALIAKRLEDWKAVRSG